MGPKPDIEDGMEILEIMEMVATKVTRIHEDLHKSEVLHKSPIDSDFYMQQYTNIYNICKHIEIMEMVATKVTRIHEVLQKSEVLHKSPIDSDFYMQQYTNIHNICKQLPSVGFNIEHYKTRDLWELISEKLNRADFIALASSWPWFQDSVCSNNPKLFIRRLSSENLLPKLVEHHDWEYMYRIAKFQQREDYSRHLAHACVYRSKDAFHNLLHYFWVGPVYFGSQNLEVKGADNMEFETVHCIRPGVWIGEAYETMCVLCHPKDLENTGEGYCPEHNTLFSVRHSTHPPCEPHWYYYKYRHEGSVTSHMIPTALGRLAVVRTPQGNPQAHGNYTTSDRSNLDLAPLKSKATTDGFVFETRVRDDCIIDENTYVTICSVRDHEGLVSHIYLEFEQNHDGSSNSGPSMKSRYMRYFGGNWVE